MDSKLHNRLTEIDDQADFHKQRHIFDLKMKAFDAEYLSLKVESQVIKRQL